MNNAIEIANGMQIFAKYKCEFTAYEHISASDSDRIYVKLFQKLSKNDILELNINNWNMNLMNYWYYDLDK